MSNKVKKKDDIQDVMNSDNMLDAMQEAGMDVTIARTYLAERKLSKLIGYDDVKNGLIKDFMKAFFNVLIDLRYILKRSDIRQATRIDYYPCCKLDEDISALPSMHHVPKEVFEEEKHNFYLMIPPFMHGVLVINKLKYIHWTVDTINESERSISVTLSDYARDHGIWGLWSLGRFTLKLNPGNTPVASEASYVPLDAMIEYYMEQHEIDDKVYEHLTKIFIDRGGFVLENELKKLKKDYLDYVLTWAKDTKKDEDAANLLRHFMLAIEHVNYMLANNKIKTLRGSGNTIKTVAGEVETNPKPKYTRVLSNGIQFFSEKIPRPHTEETIRKYHVTQWNTRGHVRRYKSGLVTYVRPSIHYRKCLIGKGESELAQQIIQVV